MLVQGAGKCGAGPTKMALCISPCGQATPLPQKIDSGVMAWLAPLGAHQFEIDRNFDASRSRAKRLLEDAEEMPRPVERPVPAFWRTLVAVRDAVACKKTLPAQSRAAD